MKRPERSKLEVSNSTDPGLLDNRWVDHQLIRMTRASLYRWKSISATLMESTFGSEMLVTRKGDRRFIRKESAKMFDSKSFVAT